LSPHPAVFSAAPDAGFARDDATEARAAQGKIGVIAGSITRARLPAAIARPRLSATPESAGRTVVLQQAKSDRLAPLADLLASIGRAARQRDRWMASRY
jgi:hypothetical protein